MALARRTSSRRRTLGGGGTTTFSGGTSSGRMGIEEYTQRLEASHRLQVERSLISSDNVLERSRATSEMTMARWLSQQQVLLVDRRDKEALDRISKGDAAYGMSYAQRRMGEAKAAGNDDDYVYWRDIAGRSKERAEDDYISGLVAAGDFGPEDILPVLRQRQAEQKVGSPGYMALSKQIGEANLAVKAAKFNRDISAAQARFTESGDRKAFMGDLLGFYANAKETTVRTQLQTRITNLQKELDTEGETARKKAVTEKVVAYYADRGENPASGVLFHLAEAVRNAKTPAEAQGLITLAQSITSRERTLQQDAIRAAGGSGRSGSGSGSAKTAIDKELEDERLDLKHATGHLKDSVIGKSKIPTDAEWAIYWAAGDRALAGIDAALTNGSLTTAQRKTLTTERYNVTNGDNGRENIKGRVGAVVKAESARIEGEVKAAIGDGTDEAGLTNALPLLAKLKALRASPYIVGEVDHTAAVEKNIKDATAPLTKAVDDLRTSSEFTGETPKQMLGQYETFVGNWRKAHPNENGWPTVDEWIAAMSNPAFSDFERADALGMLVAPKNPKATEGPDSEPTMKEGAQGDEKQKFDAMARGIVKIEDAALRKGQMASAVLGGHKPDARALWNATEVVTGRVDMEQRRVERSMGMLSGQDLTALEASEQPPVSEGRNVIGGRGDKAFDLSRQGGINLGADQRRSPDADLLDSIFRDVGEDARDARMAGGGAPPPMDPMDGGVDIGEEARDARLGMANPDFEQASADNDPMFGNEGFLDESERTYRRTQGSREAQAASDYLDSTIDMDIPGWTFPDAADESPFLDEPTVRGDRDWDIPDLPIAEDEAYQTETGERARASRLDLEPWKFESIPDEPTNTSADEGTYVSAE